MFGWDQFNTAQFNGSSLIITLTPTPPPTPSPPLPPTVILVNDAPIESWNDRGSLSLNRVQLREVSIQVRDQYPYSQKFLEDVLIRYETNTKLPVKEDVPPDFTKGW